MNLIFLGPPGSGKGTHAETVRKGLDIPRISTGDMLREHMKQGTELGKAAESYISAGQLVPDSLVIDMLRERLAQPDCKNGAIFDGFPRTVEQAKVLDTLVKIDRVINLVISDEAIVERMKGRRVCPKCGATYHVSRLSGNTCEACGTELIIRDDDKPETVLARLKVYHEKTTPLEEYYQSTGVLRNVDTDAETEEVDVRVQGALE